jgi:hypothetical protein
MDPAAEGRFLKAWNEVKDTVWREAGAWELRKSSEV